GNVRVRAQNCRHASIQMPPHGDLFARGFGMEVHDYYFAGDLLQERIGLAKRIVGILHENASLKVDHRVALALLGCAFIDAYSGNALGIVRGTKHAAHPAAGVTVDGVEIVDDLALVPDVIAGGEHLATYIEKFIGDSRCQPEAAGCVLRVGNDQVHAIALHDVGQMVVDDFSPGAAENITDKKDLHTQSLIVAAISTQQSAFRPRVLFVAITASWARIQFRGRMLSADCYFCVSSTVVRKS